MAKVLTDVGVMWLFVGQPSTRLSLSVHPCQAHAHDTELVPIVQMRKLKVREISHPSKAERPCSPSAPFSIYGAPVLGDGKVQSLSSGSVSVHGRGCKRILFSQGPLCVVPWAQGQDTLCWDVCIASVGPDPQQRKAAFL